MTYCCFNCTLKIVLKLLNQLMLPNKDQSYFYTTFFLLRSTRPNSRSLALFERGDTIAAAADNLCAQFYSEPPRVERRSSDWCYLPARPQRHLLSCLSTHTLAGLDPLKDRLAVWAGTRTLLFHCDWLSGKREEQPRLLGGRFNVKRDEEKEGRDRKRRKDSSCRVWRTKEDNVISSPLIRTANGESFQVVTHLWEEPRLWPLTSGGDSLRLIRHWRGSNGLLSLCVLPNSCTLEPNAESEKVTFDLCLQRPIRTASPFRRWPSTGGSGRRQKTVLFLTHCVSPVLWIKRPQCHWQDGRGRHRWLKQA